MDTIFADQLKTVDVCIDDIFLDPNNPRFVGDDWPEVSDDAIDKAEVQREALSKMVRNHNVDKLRINMEENGYLPIDRIIVRQFKSDKYVVLEGNRRITAAKQIIMLHRKGQFDGGDVVASLEVIPCLEYTGSEPKAAWIFQGIRHIIGIAEWSAYSKARLLSERREVEGKTLTEVGKQFGLSRYGAGQWIRGYRAFKQVKNESNYSRELDERAYTYFQEIFHRSNIPLREWLDWYENENDDKYIFRNEQNLDEFLDWLYPKEDPDDGRDVDDIVGNWDLRVVPTARSLRDVSFLIRRAPHQFERFRSDKNLQGAIATARLDEAEARAQSENEPEEKLFRTLDAAIEQLSRIPTLIYNEDEEIKEKLIGRLSQLQETISNVKAALKG